MRFYSDKDSEGFLEIERHHLAWVRQEDGACTEKEASQVRAGDHMLIFGEAGAEPARVHAVKGARAAATEMTELHTASMKVIVSGTLVSCSSALDWKLLKALEPLAGAVCPRLMSAAQNQIKRHMHIRGLY